MCDTPPAAATPPLPHAYAHLVAEPAIWPFNIEIPEGLGRKKMSKKAAAGPIAIPPIPTYAGKPAVLTVQEWLTGTERHFTMLNKFYNIALTEEDQVALAVVQFEGRAAQWLTNQQRLGKNFKKLADLKDPLMAYFEPNVDRMRVIQDKYHAAKQRGSTAQYNDYFLDPYTQLSDRIKEEHAMVDYIRTAH